MRKLALFGAGDLGSEVLELYLSSEVLRRSYDSVIFVDDVKRGTLNGFDIIGFDDLVDTAGADRILVSICVGEPLLREKLADRVLNAGLALATLVHPDARISAHADIGPGCIIGGRSNVGANTTIGANTLVLNAHVSHNCSIGRSCVLNSGSILSCHVAVGDRTFISIGATVREGVTVGAEAIVDMGSAVFLDVEDGVFMAGNPARLMRRNEDQQVFRR